MESRNVYEVRSSSIDELRIYTNGAYILRSFSTSLGKGRFEIKVKNIEHDIDESSVRVFASPEIKVFNVSFMPLKAPRVELSSDEKKKLIDKLEQLKMEKKKVENAIVSIKARVEALEKSLETTFKSSSIAILYDKASKEKFEDLLSFIGKRHLTLLEELTLKQKELEDIDRKIKELQSALDVKAKLIDVGSLTINGTSSKEGDFDFQLLYFTPLVRWKSTYDLILNDDSGELQVFAEINQESNIVWSPKKTMVVARSIRPARYIEPSPWYIYKREMVKVAYAPRVHLKAPLPEAMEEAIELEKAYEEAEVKVEEDLIYELKEPITIEPNEPAQALLTILKITPKRYYYWDAFTMSGTLEMLEFTNGDLVLLPGLYRIFKGPNLVNRVNLGYIYPKQEVKLAVTIDGDIEVKKKMIERKEEKQGIIRDKAFIRYTYQLTIFNHKNEKIEIEVLDRLPVAKDPEIEISLENVSEKPEIDKLNIVKWKLSLDPNSKKVIEYSFQIKYPPDYKLANVP
ncbi:MAG: DUF4139 domain-containing protein [Candidatus Odinarchaeota archaeon]|nr:DUF4139 domain-containing protein [Candidatus Odinarchaeota archaeon]